MNIRFFIIAFTLFLTYSILAYSYSETFYKTNYYTRAEVHGIKQDCDICHISHNAKIIGLLKESISELCLDCHPNRKAPSEHVVDVIPSMEVGGLLLTEGMMTCVTCHDSHKNTYENMLRISPKNLCLHCHKM